MGRAEKLCTECDALKPLTEFSKDKYRPLGVKCACKACASARFSRWRRANLSRARHADRRSHYIRSYGLSPYEADVLANNRDGLCPICGAHAKLVVDHNHTTDRVRERICGGCNSMLGYSRERRDVLLAAAEYLGRHG
jgi:hypothetical protein